MSEHNNGINIKIKKNTNCIANMPAYSDRAMQSLYIIYYCHL